MINVRILTEQDAINFQTLRLRALQEEPDAFGGSYEEFKREPLSTSVERIRHNTSFPERFVLGAFERDNKLVANVGLMREQGRKKAHKAFVWGMYVAPEVRGQGIGKMLMQELIQRSTAIWGIEQLYLGVVTTNGAARHLYLSLGFRVYGVEPRALKLDEQYLDEELMIYFLLK